MHNNSTQNGKWRDEKTATETDHTYLIDSVASAFSLTNFQKERAYHLYDEIPSDFFRAYRNVSVVVALCAIAGYEDGRNYHPSLSDRDNELAAFLEQHSIDDREYRSLWGRIQNHVR
jgi:hypothetical protein